ncbi:MAG: FAD-binding oxidoreductase [Rhodobacteraceae bacterium]|nr:FAD-binding oxidoreductase [Paracoccaceae bacterium]
MILSGWGRYPRLDVTVTSPRAEDDLRAALVTGPVIARGNGRAYGDSAINPRLTLDMRGMNRMLAFDPASGQLTAEAGVTLDAVINSFLPRGWFPMVTPGTRYVTLGGMIAADVHGKNHHRDGAFGTCLDWVEVMGPDGIPHRASLTENDDLFRATLGGMGLTGIITRAAFRLRPVETAWIRQRTIPTPDLDATIEAFETHADATYSVAWIDCLTRGAGLGRSVVTLGEHATRADLPPSMRPAALALPPRRRLRVPMDAPAFALNRHTVRAFNHLYHRRATTQAGEAFVGWEEYFYPLDAILDWNRIYGRRGFVQYQCVLPPATARAGLRTLIDRIAEAGQASFLAVLKRMGPEGLGQIGFPMEGYTLALDFPASPDALALLPALDDIVLAHSGRFYLAKDARLPATTLHRADPRLQGFRAAREAAGQARHFASHQSERLGL